MQINLFCSGRLPSVSKLLVLALLSDLSRLYFVVKLNLCGYVRHNICANLRHCVVVTPPFPRGGGMAEDHGAPETAKLPKVWPRDRRETESPKSERRKESVAGHAE